MKKIRILLCDDHNIVRAGLKCLLETSDEVEVVGEAANGHECVREAKRLRPDLVVLDLAMPLLNGMEAARKCGLEQGEHGGIGEDTGTREWLASRLRGAAAL